MRVERTVSARANSARPFRRSTPMARSDVTSALSAWASCPFTIRICIASMARSASEVVHNTEVATRSPRSLPAGEPGTSMFERSKMVSFVNEHAFWSSRRSEEDADWSAALSVCADWSPQILSASWTAYTHGARSVLSSERTPSSLEMSEARDVWTGRSVTTVTARIAATARPTSIALRRYQGRFGPVGISASLTGSPIFGHRWRSPSPTV